MDIIRLCLLCSAKFCELLPGDIETGALFIEDLISHTLKSLPFILIVNNVEINFLLTMNVYAVHVCVYCYHHLKEYPDGAEGIGVRIEGLVSNAMLQLFWDVALANPDG